MEEFLSEVLELNQPEYRYLSLRLAFFAIAAYEKFESTNTPIKYNKFHFLTNAFSI